MIGTRHITDGRPGSAGPVAFADDPWTLAVLISIFVMAPTLSLVAFRIFDSCLVACAAIALVPLLRHRALGGALAISPLLVPLAFFLGWTGLTWLWTPHYISDLYEVAAMATVMASTLLMVRLMERSLDDRRITLIGLATIAVSLLSALDLWTGGGLRRLFGQPVHAFETYPAMHQQLLVAIPIAASLVKARRWGVALAMIGASILAIFSSDSDAAKLGVLMSIAVAVVAWWMPRAAAVTAGLAGSILLIATPWLIDGVLDVGTRLAATYFPGSHAFEREAIYRSAAYLARDVSILGHGAGATRISAEVWTIDAVPEALRGMFEHAFPHNLALQIWLELGVVGVALAVATWIAAIIWVYRLPPLQRTAGLVIVSISLVIAQINHSLWHCWWIASIAFGLAILQAQSCKPTSRARASGSGRQGHGGPAAPSASKG